MARRSGWSGQFWAGTTRGRWQVAGGRAGPGRFVWQAPTLCCMQVFLEAHWVPTSVRFDGLRAWAMCGDMGDGWQTAVLSNQVCCWERPFRDAGRERNVCAGICTLLFAIRTSPRFPVTLAVTSTVKRTVVPRRSTQLKVHASNLVPIAPLSQRLPLLVRCCQI